jgi:hypothetical protein
VAELGAVRAAADFLVEHHDEFPADVPLPRTTTQLAVLAVEVHETFLADPSGASTPTLPEVIVAVRAARRR